VRAAHCLSCLHYLNCQPMPHGTGCDAAVKRVIQRRARPQEGSRRKGSLQEGHITASKAAVCIESASSWCSCRPGRVPTLHILTAQRRSGCTKYNMAPSSTPPLQVTERPERLLTDRSAYILYLESQLERVTAACMTVHSFEERLEDAANHLQGLEEKVWQGLAASMHWLLHLTGK
jgi:hypothetical protein